MPPDTALLAVGGYGRGELFPHSDIDVLVLLPPGHTLAAWDASTEGGDLKTAIEGFISACWDIGLEIGSSVRTVDECIAEGRRDVTVQTALLESRFVCGSRRVFATFRVANTTAMDAKAFLVAKTLEMRQRHQKFEDTPYSLEPNCKESPGGLRDLQTVIWVARAAGLGKNWNELAANGLITAFEVKQLQHNEGLLKLIRARLHMVAGRREDRLVFDLQTAVAESFGYHGTSTTRASEVLMRRYYWAAKAVTQLNQILLLEHRGARQRLAGRADAADQRALSRPRRHARSRQRRPLRREPHAILETFLLYEQEPGIEGLSARTLRALYERARRDERRHPQGSGEPRTCSARSCSSPRGRRTPSG